MAIELNSFLALESQNTAPCYTPLTSSVNLFAASNAQTDTVDELVQTLHNEIENFSSSKNRGKFSVERDRQQYNSSERNRNRSDSRDKTRNRYDSNEKKENEDFVILKIAVIRKTETVARIHGQFDTKRIVVFNSITIEHRIPTSDKPARTHHRTTTGRQVRPTTRATETILIATPESRILAL